MLFPSARRRWIRAAAGMALLNAGGLPWSARAAGPDAARRTLVVGPSRNVKTLSQASTLARDGDEILVDPGEYRGDVAVWNQRGLVIRAASGRVVLIANGASAEDKGTFVFRGAEAVVDGLAFVGARSRDRNGSGIRLDVGSRLTVKRCRFEDNENGILTSNDEPSELHLIESQFVGNGAGDGQSHNVYVGTIGKFTATGCYFARARVGHLLKSRARESIVAYSRLSGEDGTSSYELEFPSGGRATVTGCLIQQGPRSENSTIVAFGSEGYRWERNELVLCFSTIVNERSQGGTFVRVAAGPARVRVTDNLLVGRGEMDVRTAASTVRNVAVSPDELRDTAKLDYRLRRGSRYVGSAGMVGAVSPECTAPEREYVHPASSVALDGMSPLTPLSPGAFQRLAP